MRRTVYLHHVDIVRLQRGQRGVDGLRHHLAAVLGGILADVHPKLGGDDGLLAPALQRDAKHVLRAAVAVNAVCAAAP